MFAAASSQDPMKNPFVILLAALFPLVAKSNDPVGMLDRKYQTIAAEGLLSVHNRHIAELEKVKAAAMQSSNLTEANRAADRIKALQIEAIELKKKLENLREGETEYPGNEFYRMTFTTGKTGTEKGARIPLQFERLPLNDFAGDKLLLLVSAANSKDAETAHEVFVFDEASGKEVGKISGLGRGKTKKIPLLLPPSDVLKLSLTVKGGDALHLKQVKKGIPEVYLVIEE